MDEQLRMIVEIAFNIAYLIAIWTIVVIMFTRNAGVGAWAGADPSRPVGVESRARWGFFLLALGDTGHVGFRVWAYALGDLEARIMGISLVGAGALATAVTVTVLYMLLLDIWRLEKGSRTLAWWGLMATGVVRLVLMALPGNAWDSVVPPFGWSLARNAGLTVLGLGVAVLFIWDLESKFYRTVGVYILFSYGFYLPVILLVQKVPTVGMLMIPKTIMYILMAVLAVRTLYRRAEPAEQRNQTGTTCRS